MTTSDGNGGTGTKRKHGGWCRGCACYQSNNGNGKTDMQDGTNGKTRKAACKQ